MPEKTCLRVDALPNVFVKFRADLRNSENQDTAKAA
jgi:hypothetical protein